MIDESRMILAVVSTASLFYLITKLSQPKSTLRQWIVSFHRPWLKVGEVSQILLHPIKSCRGVSVDWALCGERGLSHNEMVDRHFMIWDKNENKMVTARQTPKMLLISPIVEDGIIRLRFKDEQDDFKVVLEEVMLLGSVVTATIWDSSIDAYDCGDGVAQWISNKLDATAASLRLLYYADELRHKNRRSLNQMTNVHNAHALAKYNNFKAQGRKDNVAFADCTPYDLGCETSLRDLNERIEKPVTFRSFRPNFVVKGETKPYDEDCWKEICIGSAARFTHVSACSRCVLTTVDPDTGLISADNQPLKTLRKYRLAPESARDLYGFSPLFCINLGIDAAGLVKVGDPVFVRYK